MPAAQASDTQVAAEQVPEELYTPPVQAADMLEPAVLRSEELCTPAGRASDTQAVAEHYRAWNTRALPDG